MKKRPIVSFVVLAMFITYAIGLPWYFLTSSYEQAWHIREELLSLFFMRAGPTLAGLAVVVAIAGRQGLLTWFNQLFKWRINPFYYVALAVLVIGTFVGTNFVLPDASAVLSSPDLSATRDWPSLFVSYLQEIAYISATNGEETGWRFALLGLLLVRQRLLVACLVVGVIWAFWHMPAFFLFGQAALWYPLILICIAYALIYGWLYRETGSLFIVVLAHGAANATYYTFERHFTDLSARWDSFEPWGDWAFGAISLAAALLVVALRWKLFFAAPSAATSVNSWTTPK